MARKRLINIHEVRNHNGAWHQSQEVEKTLFLISSRHTPFFTVLFFSAFSVALYLWIALCLCQGISMWMCAGGRSTRWETRTDLSSLCTHFHLHSRGRTPLGKLPQQLVSHTHTVQMLSTARLCSSIYMCICKPQTFFFLCQFLHWSQRSQCMFLFISICTVCMFTSEDMIYQMKIALIK